MRGHRSRKRVASLRVHRFTKEPVHDLVAAYAHPLRMRMIEMLAERKLRVLDLFQSFDRNESGSVGLEEFARAVGGALQVTDEEVRTFFVALNADADGKVSYAVLHRVLKRVPRGDSKMEVAAREAAREAVERAAAQRELQAAVQEAAAQEAAVRGALEEALEAREAAARQAAAKEAAAVHMAAQQAAEQAVALEAEVQERAAGRTPLTTGDGGGGGRGVISHRLLPDGRLRQEVDAAEPTGGARAGPTPRRPHPLLEENSVQREIDRALRVGRELAAVRIQALARRRVVTRTLGAIKAVSVLLQSAARARLARRAVLQHPRRQAALTIQCHARGRFVRAALAHALEERRMSRAVLVVKAALVSGRTNQLKSRVVSAVHAAQAMVRTQRADMLVDFLRAAKLQSMHSRNITAVHRYVVGPLRAARAAEAAVSSSASEYDWRRALEEVKRWEDGDERIQAIERKLQQGKGVAPERGSERGGSRSAERKKERNQPISDGRRSLRFQPVSDESTPRRTTSWTTNLTDGASSADGTDSFSRNGSPLPPFRKASAFSSTAASSVASSRQSTTRRARFARAHDGGILENTMQYEKRTETPRKREHAEGGAELGLPRDAPTDVVLTSEETRLSKRSQSGRSPRFRSSRAEPEEPYDGKSPLPLPLPMPPMPRPHGGASPANPRPRVPPSPSATGPGAAAGTFSSAAHRRAAGSPKGAAPHGRSPASPGAGPRRSSRTTPRSIATAADFATRSRDQSIAAAAEFATGFRSAPAPSLAPPRAPPRAPPHAPPASTAAALDGRRMATPPPVPPADTPPAWHSPPSAKALAQHTGTGTSASASTGGGASATATATAGSSSSSGSRAADAAAARRAASPSPRAAPRAQGGSPAARPLPASGWVPPNPPSQPEVQRPPPRRAGEKATADKALGGGGKAYSVVVDTRSGREKRAKPPPSGGGNLLSGAVDWLCSAPRPLKEVTPVQDDSGVQALLRKGSQRFVKQIGRAVQVRELAHRLTILPSCLSTPCAHLTPYALRPTRCSSIACSPTPPTSPPPHP